MKKITKSEIENFLDGPWQEDLEIEICSLLNEYRHLLRDDVEPFQSYMKRFKYINSSSFLQKTTENFQLVFDLLSSSPE